MSTALATRPHSPLIRIRPAPSPEPAEDLRRFGDRDLPPRPRIDWAGADRGHAASGAEPDAHRGHATSGADLSGGRPSEARLAAHRYLSLCVEVLGGFRPVAHLRAMTAVEAYDRVVAQLHPGRAGRGAQAGARPAAERVVLRHVRVCEPVDGTAEVAAVLSRGDRVWAMALRLERSPFGWLCRELWVV